MENRTRNLQVFQSDSLIIIGHNCLQWRLPIDIMISFIKNQQGIIVKWRAVVLYQVSGSLTFQHLNTYGIFCSISARILQTFSLTEIK